MYNLKQEVSNLTSSHCPTNNLTNETSTSMSPRERLNRMECLEELPDAWMDKWKPDVSRWKGFDEIARIKNITVQEAVQFKKKTIVLKRTHNLGMSLQMYLWNQRGPLYHMTGPCAFYCKTRKFTAYLNTGMLHIEGDITTRNGTKTRYVWVYGIDDNDLI